MTSNKTCAACRLFSVVVARRRASASRWRFLWHHTIDLLVGEAPDPGLMRRAKPQLIPFYGLRQRAFRAVAGWYGFLDTMGR